jgi:uncharacterized protein (TIGR01777 family)
MVHLAGEDIAQRWNDETLERIRSSREIGTRNLVAGIAAADPRPRALISASAVGYYGNRHDPIDEDAQPGNDVLADICVAWEREADKASELGLRVARIRTGVVLDRQGGALPKMLLPFRLGVGGPIAGGRQPLPWIHVEDGVGIYLAAIEGARESPEAAGDRPRSGVRGPHPLRRHGHARRRRAARAPATCPRARLRVPSS